MKNVKTNKDKQNKEQISVEFATIKEGLTGNSIEDAKSDYRKNLKLKCFLEKNIDTLDLYNITEKEIEELKNWNWNQTITEKIQEIYDIYDDIQIEEEEQNKKGKIIIRKATGSDFEGIIKLYKRFIQGDKKIPAINKSWVHYRLGNGVIIIATTESGYIVGLASFLVDEYRGRYGYDFIIIVSKLHMDLGIEYELFDAITEWSEKQALSQFSTFSLIDKESEFVKHLAKTRENIKIGYGNIGIVCFYIENDH